MALPKGMRPFSLAGPTLKEREYQEKFDAILEAQRVEIEEIEKRQVRERVAVYQRYRAQLKELYARYGVDPETGEMREPEAGD